MLRDVALLGPLDRRGQSIPDAGRSSRTGPDDLGAVPIPESSRAPKGRRRSLPQLAAVVVSAFDRVEPRGPVGSSALWAGTLVALLVYHRRVHESGLALCLFSLRWGRVIAATAALVAATAVVDLLSETAATVLVLFIAVTFLPLGAAAARALPAQARIARHTPPGRHKHIYSLASTKSGAGADVVRDLCLEADAKDWSLVLDAGSQALVNYYEGFGFRPCGNPVKMPHGQVHVRMCRPPSASAGREAR